MCRCKKYCAAQVVMLRSALMPTTSEIVSMTGIPTSSVVNIINRRCPELKQPIRQRVPDIVVEMVEFDYLAGDSTYAIGEKYGINHSTVSKLMKKRGHYRGKHQGPAYERSRQQQHEEAKRRWLDELDKLPDESSGKRPRQVRREARIASRPHDRGINWKSLAKRNGSMRCEICGIECDPTDREWGTQGPTHPSVDHIVRIADGGTDTWDNSRLACCACNLKLNEQKRREVEDAEKQATC